MIFAILLYYYSRNGQGCYLPSVLYYGWTYSASQSRQNTTWEIQYWVRWLGIEQKGGN